MKHYTCTPPPSQRRARACVRVCVREHLGVHTLHTFFAYFSTEARRHSASLCVITQRAHFAYFAHFFPNSLGV